MTKITCISDTHETFPLVGSGDILIHAGDATYYGDPIRTKEFFEWMGDQDFKLKLFCAGNHDINAYSHSNREIAKKMNVAILDGETWESYNGLTIFGSPIQPIFGSGWAFNQSEMVRKSFWETQLKADILVTHCPARGILDYIKFRDEHVGCVPLANYIKKHSPKLHVCGHIHSNFGVSHSDKTLCVNAAQLNDRYEKVNDPIIVYL